MVSILVIVALTAGAIAMAVPSPVAQPILRFFEDRYLPHFLLGLLALAVLLNIYLVSQKWNAGAEQRIHNENRPRSVSLADPVTHLLSTALGVERCAGSARH